MSEMDDHAVAVGPGTPSLERVLPGPVETVWAYLTEPEKRGLWLATGPMDLRPGGRVELHFRHADLSPRKVPTPERYKGLENGHSVHGRITRCNPPRELSFTWGEGSGTGSSGEPSEVTFELTAKGGSVLLMLTHRRLTDRAGMATVSVAGGWHTHLGILVDRLHGREPQPFWPSHALLEKEYAARLGAGCERRH